MADFRATQRTGDYLDYAFDFNPWLNGATGIGATYSVSPAVGMTLVDGGFAAGLAQFSVSSLVTGGVFLVSCTLSTTNDVLTQVTEFYIEP